MLRISFS